MRHWQSQYVNQGVRPDSAGGNAAPDQAPPHIAPKIVGVRHGVGKLSETGSSRCARLSCSTASSGCPSQRLIQPPFVCALTRLGLSSTARSINSFADERSRSRYATAKPAAARALPSSFASEIAVDDLEHGERPGAAPIMMPLRMPPAFPPVPFCHAPWRSAALSRIVISDQRLKMQTTVR